VARVRGYDTAGEDDDVQRDDADEASLRLEPDLKCSVAEWQEAVRAKVEEAVRLHLIAYVPVGAFLSGGIDSALTAVIAADAVGPENVIGVGIWNGVSNPNEDGSALFIGFGDLSGANIGGILISTDSGDPSFANDFAIDDVSLTYAPLVPEPGTIVLLGTGLLGVAGTLHRKLMA